VSARPKQKEIEINGNRYQLRKLDALMASWILNLLVVTSSKNQPNSKLTEEERASIEAEMGKLTPEERGSNMVKLMWATAGAELDFERYQKIQNLALKACGWLSPASSKYEPVIMSDGRITVGALEDDPVAVTKLVGESLEFNLSVFFTVNALRAESSLTDSQPPNALR
jgi:hypothetical protein